MTHKILILALFICSPVLLAFAQDATSSTSTATTTEATVTTPEAPRQTEVRRAALSAVAQVRLTNLAANVSNRLDAYVRRISNVTGRLESRATKMEAEGIDVGVARTKIDEAKRELDTARGALANIDVEVATFVGSQNPRERWQNLRTTYETARTAIIAAHKATVEAVLLLKTATAVPTATDTSTSTDTVQ